MSRRMKTTTAWGMTSDMTTPSTTIEELVGRVEAATLSHLIRNMKGER